MELYPRLSPLAFPTPLMPDIADSRIDILPWIFARPVVLSAVAIRQKGWV